MMPRSRVVAAIVVASVLDRQPARAQKTATAASSREASRSWVHEAWTVRDGLPVNSVNALLQDREGYIWAATYDGLVRFDGVRFTVYNSANTPGLPSNRFVTLHRARDGAIWIGTEQNHLVRLRAGQFRTLTPPGSDGTETITAFAEDSTGRAWVGSARGLWMVAGDQLQRRLPETIRGRVSAILVRRDGSVIVATSGDGVYRVSADGGRGERFSVNTAIDTARVARVEEDGAGTLWLATTAGLWSRRTDGELRPESQLPETWATTPASGALFVTSDDGIYRVGGNAGARVVTWPGPFDGHRVFVDRAADWYVEGGDVVRGGRRIFRVPADSGTTQAEQPLVVGVLLDRDGSLWLGTTSAGLHRLKPAPFTTYGAPEGVGNNVYPVFVDRDGAIWTGAWRRGVSRIDPATGAVRSLVTPGFATTFPYSLAELPNGELLIGYGGLLACNRTTFACHDEAKGVIPPTTIFALHTDRTGRTWVGTQGAVYTRDASGWRRVVETAWPSDARARGFEDTKDGALWIATNGRGLARLASDSLTFFTTASGLPSNIIRSLYEDADGWLWIGTEGQGLARIDPREWARGPQQRHRAVRIGSAQGLFDDVIHQILEDDRGRLWMSTNHGVFWVSRAELNAFAEGKIASVHSVSYTERDGMRNREANGGMQPAGARGADGRLWFPTQDGVVVVDPAAVRSDRGVSTVVVERVVADTAIRATAPGDAAARVEVSLGPTARDFQVDYTAPTFLEPFNVRFRYRLDGYDEGWVEAGGRRTAFYTKVPPGHYTFRVQAAGAGGEWREPGAMLLLHVTPRLVETTLFRGAVALALVVAAIVAVRLRDARLRERARTLERVVDERTTALRERERELAAQNAQLAAQAEQLRSVDQAKTRFFSNVSHELRTPLTLTIGPLEDLRAEVGANPRAERWLDIALRNSRRLLRLVNQILDVAKLEAGAMKLAPRPLDLAPFTRGIVAAFAPVAERKGLRLSLAAPESLGGVMDSDAVEKVLTNLLSNAVKFTPVGGVVEVTLSCVGDEAVLAVRDSGPGIPPDQLAYVFERFHQVDESSSRAQPGTGIGLSLVKELVELHGGAVSVISSGDGTCFTVTMPLGVDANGAVVMEQATTTLYVTGESVGTAVVASGGTEPGSGDDRDEAGEGGERADDIPTLLVVDDSADLRGYIRGHFEGRFRVLEGGDGKEGIALARRHLPDVIVSDVMMPGTDGIALVRALRGSAETDFLPIILLTARADDEHRLSALELGADEYLVKPFEMRELDARVRNVIASRRRLRERYSTFRRVEVTPAVVVDEPSAADQAFARKVTLAIATHIADADFGVTELAAAVGLDRTQLFRRARDLFGESPSELVRRIRLQEGARLLDEGKGSVADVAYATGFNSVSHFARRFQEAYGVTPAQYRKRGSGAGSAG